MIIKINVSGLAFREDTLQLCGDCPRWDPWYANRMLNRWDVSTRWAEWVGERSGPQGRCSSCSADCHSCLALKGLGAPVIIVLWNKSFHSTVPFFLCLWCSSLDGHSSNNVSHGSHLKTPKENAVVLWAAFHTPSLTLFPGVPLRSFLRAHWHFSLNTILTKIFIVQAHIREERHGRALLEKATRNDWITEKKNPNKNSLGLSLGRLASFRPRIMGLRRNFGD